MSTGGVFQLISNDGKQDRLLMSTHMLNKRLDQIRKLRRSKGLDEQPTLQDVECTHVLFVNAKFKPFAAIAYEYMKTNPQTGTTNLGGQVTFSIPQFGDFFSDMMLRVVFDTPTTSGTDPVYRWCDYPGERLLKKVGFEVNGNPLDEYTRDEVVFHRKFRVQPNKLEGWKRCMGQESPRVGYFNQNDTNLSGVTAADDYRVVAQVSDGHQTWKATHDKLELNIPLLFWFNLDTRLAVPSVSIPYGQRFINVEFASKDEMVAVKSADSTASDTTITEPGISTCELYINNLFVTPEIHDIFIQRVGFNLIRVHRRQVQQVQKAEDRILLSALKWPIETLHVGFQPSRNTSTSTSEHVDWWHRMAAIQRQTKSAVSATVDTTAATTTTAIDVADYGFAGSFAGGWWDQSQRVVDRVTIEAHGIELYKNMPVRLFDSYQPLMYGDHCVNVPDDEGAMTINFNLYPGHYQPSGHINLSRAREFYISYTSSLIGTTFDGSTLEASMKIAAIALNFLLISDGSAVLRYST